MGITKYLSAKSGTYKDKSGAEKNSYVRVGVMMETRNGEMIKLEALPVNFDGWIYLKDPDQQQKPQSKTAEQPSGGNFNDFDDDIPF